MDLTLVHERSRLTDLTACHPDVAAAQFNDDLLDRPRRLVQLAAADLLS